MGIRSAVYLDTLLLAKTVVIRRKVWKNEEESLPAYTGEPSVMGFPLDIDVLPESQDNTPKKKSGSKTALRLLTTGSYKVFTFRCASSRSLVGEKGREEPSKELNAGLGHHALITKAVFSFFLSLFVSFPFFLQFKDKWLKIYMRVGEYRPHSVIVVVEYALATGKWKTH